MQGSELSIFFTDHKVEILTRFREMVQIMESYINH
jgi:hypothetical protein